MRASPSPMAFSTAYENSQNLFGKHLKIFGLRPFEATGPNCPDSTARWASLFLSCDIISDPKPTEAAAVAPHRLQASPEHSDVRHRRIVNEHVLGRVLAAACKIAQQGSLEVMEMPALRIDQFSNFEVR